ncbi:MAG TPA: hypothetical protein VGM90_13350 [Kofleriaceae bacterium]|jgi:hypothetical protein
MARGRRTDYFTQLGERIEKRWIAAGYDDAALPPIAEAELRRTPPHEHVSAWELTQVARNPGTMLEQGSAGFGQPPLAVWGSERMYIEVLYWLNATTAIHQHSFSGAFAVLEGSSLHTQYKFRPDKKVAADLHLGRLTWTSSELLAKGAIHQIHSGPNFIHALFHLDHPSVSVVVRNYEDVGAPPQLGYFPPGVGVEPFIEPKLERALELSKMLVEIGRLRDAEKILVGIVNHGDLMAVYLALSAIGRSDAERTLRERVRDRARARHGAVVDTLAEGIDQHVEAQRVNALRSNVTDPDLRFFLAVLLVVPTPSALRRLITERSPRNDFVTAVMQSLTALAPIDAFPFPLDAAQLRVIELMMRGKTLTAIKRERPDAAPLHARAVASPYIARLVAAARLP